MRFVLAAAVFLIGSAGEAIAETRHADMASDVAEWVRRNGHKQVPVVKDAPPACTCPTTPKKKGK